MQDRERVKKYVLSPFHKGRTERLNDLPGATQEEISTDPRSAEMHP